MAIPRLLVVIIGGGLAACLPEPVSRYCGAVQMTVPSSDRHPGLRGGPGIAYTRPRPPSLAHAGYGPDHSR